VPSVAGTTPSRIRGADMQEVDVEAVDLGQELRQRIQPRLDIPPVVVGAPVVDEFLECRQLHAL
jgi:hypothetical protein